MDLSAKSVTARRRDVSFSGRRVFALLLRWCMLPFSWYGVRRCVGAAPRLHDASLTVTQLQVAGALEHVGVSSSRVAEWPGAANGPVRRMRAARRVVVAYLHCIPLPPWCGCGVCGIRYSVQRACCAACFRRHGAPLLRPSGVTVRCHRMWGAGHRPCGAGWCGGWCGSRAVMCMVRGAVVGWCGAVVHVGAVRGEGSRALSRTDAVSVVQLSVVRGAASGGAWCSIAWFMVQLPWFADAPRGTRGALRGIRRAPGRRPGARQRINRSGRRCGGAARRTEHPHQRPTHPPWRPATPPRRHTPPPRRHPPPPRRHVSPLRRWGGAPRWCRVAPARLTCGAVASYAAAAKR